MKHVVACVHARFHQIPHSHARVFAAVRVHAQARLDTIKSVLDPPALMIICKALCVRGKRTAL
jgi:hypothetical protein